MTALTESEGKPKNFALCECALPKREAEMEGQHKHRCSKNRKLSMEVRGIGNLSALQAPSQWNTAGLWFQINCHF
jgi:hypothetical protein